MPNLFEVTDPRGRKVVCTEERWSGHVLQARPWMKGWEEEVRAAIEEPYFGVYQDADYPNRNIYYRLHKGKDRYIKVVVSFEDEVGRVVTAFPMSSPKAGEKLIWPESSD